MAGGGDYLDFVLDCMAGVGPVRGVRFFGVAAIVRFAGEWIMARLERRRADQA